MSDDNPIKRWTAKRKATVLSALMARTPIVAANRALKQGDPEPMKLYRAKHRKYE